MLPWTLFACLVFILSIAYYLDMYSKHVLIYRFQSTCHLVSEVMSPSGGKKRELTQKGSVHLKIDTSAEAEENK